MEVDPDGEKTQKPLGRSLGMFEKVTANAVKFLMPQSCVIQRRSLVHLLRDDSVGHFGSFVQPFRAGVSSLGDLWRIQKIDYKIN